MSIRIACVHDSRAYLPELHAYSEYLRGSRSIHFEAMSHSAWEGVACEDYNLVYHFMGFYPFWKRSQVPEIHEYHSLSVPPFAQAKDVIKRCLNRKPAGRVYLNKQVESVLGFSDSLPGILRDMGVHQRFFDVASAGYVKEFDIVYCGTIVGRKGLLEAIKACLDASLSVLVVGSLDNPEWLNSLGEQKCLLTVTGAVAYDDVPGWIVKARFGLNFIPDVYPFNLQTSTKVLEYCAAGLGIVTNDYAWVRDFETRYDASFYRMETGLSRLKKEDARRYSACVDSLEWSLLLDGNGFESFLVECSQA
ncbi:hypothetical protein [uncultured Alcanivorax sp.]|jgi:hypothetical protein|uniref:hypothetical protein n=1 Tax=uncultured Alcanivorax sp. TaxID=191215 RepID=UPI002584E20D|nr:hypothetical protein [uncultured Alcanivorax sp.]